MNLDDKKGRKIQVTKKKDKKSKGQNIGARPRN